MAKISEQAQQLIDLLFERDVPETTTIGFMLELKSDENYGKLYKWLKQNPNVDKDAMFEQIDIITA